MKLFARYSRVNIVAAIGVLLLGGICYYFLIRYTLIHQLDNTLRVEEAEILDHVRTTGELPEPTHYRDQQIEFEPASTPIPRQFINTALAIRGEHRHRPYRQLLFSLNIHGQYYTATVAKSEEETKELLGLILLITLSVILLLLLIVFLTNRFLLRKIWKPFYQTLDSLKQFNLSSRPLVTGEETGIDEFRDLNEALRQMTAKILRDYEILKNFSDNASHEMQTPLAIINSKLDLLIQGHSLDEAQTKQLQGMYDAVGRLRQLNQSLLLLTKIENQQFAEMESLSLERLLDRKLLQFGELIVAEDLNVTRDTIEQTPRMNAYLADILLNNLFSNAIRHNRTGGTIHILVQEGLLSISNSGPALPFDPSTIFDRFVKNGKSGGTGLGLSIVKQICDNYHYTLSYSQSGENHTLTIYFPSQLSLQTSTRHPS